MKFLNCMTAPALSSKSLVSTASTLLAALCLSACGGGQLSNSAVTSAPSTSAENVKSIQVTTGQAAALSAFEQTSTTVAEQVDAKNAPAYTTNPTRAVQDANTPTLAPTVCPYLISGKYRILDIQGSDTTNRVGVGQFDAATLSGVNPLGKPFKLNTVHNAPCRFTTGISATDQAQIVAPSGMLFSLSPSGVSASYALSIVMPEVASSLKDISGTYVYTAYERTSPAGLLTSSQGVVTIDSNGEFVGQDCGNNTGACNAPQRLTRFAPSPKGGYYDAENLAHNNSGRSLYYLPAANNRASFVMLQPGNQGLVIGTRQAANTLPAVGRVTAGWDLTMQPSGLMTTLSFGGALATISVDAGASSYIRRRVSDGRTDTFTINSPLAGLNFRPSTISTLFSGSTTTVSSVASMGLRNLGVSVSSRVTTTVADGFLGFSIDKLSRFSNVTFSEIYKYSDPTGSITSIGSTTVGTNDLLTIEGAIHRITDTNTTGGINIYPQGASVSLTAVNAGFNSRLLVLCNNVPGQSMTKSTHILVPNSLVPVTSATEVGTRTLVGREDCQAPSQTITFALDGSAVYSDIGGTQTVSATDMASLLSPTGFTRAEPGSGQTLISKLKLYKAASPNPLGGTPNVFFVMVEVGRNLTVPGGGYLVYWSQ